MKDILADLLPQLDDTFTKIGTPISQRPMSAARFIVDNLIIEVEGDTKEDYLKKPWFKGIFQPVLKWFIARYGESQLHPKPDSIHGAIKHYGACYLLRIPLTLSQPQQDGTGLLIFPKDVLPEESPISWIINGPNLADMRQSKVASLATLAMNNAGQIRAIVNDLRTATFAEKRTRDMVGSVMRHLDKAVIDMCTSNHEAESLAIWDLHMACEKTIKAYLTQEGIAYPMIHDLRELNRLAPSKHDWSSVKVALGNFPSESRVMKWRYQELPAPNLSELWKYYGVALKLCAVYASRMSRKYVFNNFTVHLRKPPWT